ncbi:histidine phosphatase family protein [Peptostreptococcus sp.]|uniref:histidine phosphatase family protein n=1 Tax=Peptostreptococcus sp. TaxID=1262 RepID=UPI002FCB6ABB
MFMKKLYLIRHAHTKDNELEKYSGYSDTDLSDTGKIQAEELNEFLKKNIEVDKIYTSILKRTGKTIGEYANSQNIEIEKLEGLNEMNFGIFDGLSLNEIKETYPDDYQNFMRGKIDFRFPEGEDVQEFYDRNINAFKKIVKDCEDVDTVMICAHMGTLRNIISYLLVDSFRLHWNIRIENATVTIIEFMGSFPVVKMLGYVPYDMELLRPHIGKKIVKDN